MSRQRVCDLDGTVINPKVDRYFTLADSATGEVKDVCLMCSRSNLGVLTWTASTGYLVGQRVRKTAGAMGKWVWECVQAGTSDINEPVWPQAAGAFIVDGTVRWVTVLSPNNNTQMTVKKPNQPNAQLSLFGLVTGTGELT